MFVYEDEPIPDIVCTQEGWRFMCLARLLHAVSRPSQLETFQKEAFQLEGV